MERSTMPIGADSRIDRTLARGLAPQLVTFPEGQSIVAESLCFTLMTGNDDAGPFIGLVAVAQHAGVRLGSVTAFTADEARDFAASIVAAANQLDGGPRN
ncbi:hypothetical protein [Novosphingobium sp. SG720]|uniref:hypothetical protein n=1 Tax=Novosphingobium sp. SG720 TaxID=2586998 RepID=UPI001444D7B0|nr:hypothetical protein [Novosphingobium sp. SG720]NKJ43695.1 hypothetical protein [Novosphingobium sp. SG720]